MRWDGRRWNEAEAVNRDDSELGYELTDNFTSIDAVAPSEAWATHNGVVRGDVQRWNGRTWKIAHVFGARSILADIAAPSSNDVWAVGPTSYSPEKQRPLVVHWNGSAWRVQPTPFSGLRATLESLSVLSPNDVWAVGNGLIARYSC
jgi:hypothetical protein